MACVRVRESGELQRWLALERFDYSRVGRQWAVLRLLTGLADQLGAPAQAMLVVSHGQRYETFPARACALERRLGGRQAGVVASKLLWRASFAVPLEVVEFEDTRFELTAAGRTAFGLPSPELRIVTPQALRFADPGPRTPPLRPGPAAGHMRHRIVALATAVAVTATSTPAVSLAASGLTGNAPNGAAARADAGHSRAGARARVRAQAAARHEALRAALDRSAAHPAKRHRPGSSRSAAKSASRSAVTRTAVTHVLSAPLQWSSPKVCKPQTGTIYAHAAATEGLQTGHLPTGEKSGAAGCSTPTTAPQKPPATTAPTSPPNRPVVKTPSGPPPNRLVADGGHGDTSRSHGHARHRGTSGRAPLNRLISRRLPKLSSSPPGQTTPTSPGSTPTQLLSSSPATFTAPSSWTGSVSTDPSLAGALNNLSALLANGDQPPAFLIPIYMEAGRRYGVPWQVLAAINAIESDYGRDLSTSSAGAVGWMQFEPGTWQEYGKPVDGHSVANPYDPRDAIFAAAHYLAAAGAADNISQAVFAYNHAGWYVDQVLSRAHAIADNVHPGRMKIKRDVVSVYFANPRRKHHVAVYRGGVMSHYDRLIASANMVSAANFPYLYGGGHEQPARFGPFDCSGSVSYVVQQAGYRVPTTVSGDIPVWKFPAGPGRITIFYNPIHTFMRIGDRYFGTSGFARSGGGAGWFDTATLPASYLAQFREVHIPLPGVNSFAPATTPATTPRSG